MTSHLPSIPRRGAVAALAAGLGLTLALSACGGSSNPLSSGGASSSAASGGSKTLVVGSADFTESQIIAELYAGALNAAGIPATTKPNIGAREVYYKAVQDDSIDIVPDYTGNLLLYLDPKATQVSASDIASALPNKLPKGLGVLDPAQAEDKDAMVVTKATATKYSLESIADMSKVCSDLVIGAPATFEQRAYGLPGLKSKYNCVPKQFQPFNDGGGPVTLKALLSNDIQVADIFTTTPSIPDNDLVVLADPKNNFIAQQVVPLVNTANLTDAAKKVLNNVSSKLTTTDLINLNRAVSGNQKQSPADAAKAWLKDKGLAS
ncbi:ABC transporter substrate-binding protein [Sinomonas humi]|uniref:Glycine/betaine ABC transporter substrate-binding protein n=1 Tax=Sinomonas humi TaxID=1338436 RepID=A0A0B2AI17_9MICC|nr:ABC transporter substrate-binding protein [Sinomonas humi]KHL01563.1 glycine/betaine ABC transporter substrate-binding protein [Sinomonas humi]